MSNKNYEIFCFQKRKDRGGLYLQGVGNLLLTVQMDSTGCREKRACVPLQGSPVVVGQCPHRYLPRGRYPSYPCQLAS